VGIQNKKSAQIPQKKKVKFRAKGTSRNRSEKTGPVRESKAWTSSRARAGSVPDHLLGVASGEKKKKRKVQPSRRMEDTGWERPSFLVATRKKGGVQRRGETKKGKKQANRLSRHAVSAHSQDHRQSLHSENIRRAPSLQKDRKRKRSGED